MSDTVTIIGKVATDPVLAQTGGGVPVTNFRLASTHRRYDQATRSWVDAGTNWYSVAAYRQLGEHAKASLRTGDSVIVTGRLRIRTWESNGKQGTSVDIDAEAVGHDLRWGTTAYLRSSRAGSSDPTRTNEDREPTAGATSSIDADLAQQAVADPQPGVDDLDTRWAEVDGEPPMISAAIG